MEVLLGELASFHDGVKVGAVFRDFYGRRSALIKALTDDVHELYDKCDLNVLEGLCLFGNTDGRWRLAPVTDIPSNLGRRPTSINFYRDGMRRDDWLDYVAHSSDIWLVDVADFKSRERGFREGHRTLLQKKIEHLPTVLEVARIRRKSRAKVQQVLDNFTARRRALIRALTKDAYDLYRQCNPYARALRLFGNTDGQWRVEPLVEDVPPDFPQPIRGINHFRDSVDPDIWLFWVARNSDDWLRSLLVFEVVDIELHEVDRLWLQDMILHLPTLCEIVDIRYFNTK